MTGRRGGPPAARDASTRKGSPVTTTDTSTTSSALTAHAALAAWVEEVAALTTPDAVHWVDGSDEENARIVDALVDGGTFVRLAGKPDSYWCACNPSDVARVEDRTFICSRLEEDAGPTNHWMDPDDMRATMTGLYRGAMARPHDVRHPLRDGPARRRPPVLRRRDHRQPLRRGQHAHHGADRRARCSTGWAPDAPFVKCLHSVGAPLEPGPGGRRVAVQHDEVHHPLPGDREIWSYGSRLRRQRPARQEVLLAADRLARWPATRAGWPSTCSSSSSPSPEQKVYYVAAAFPSACGKTNMAMIEPTVPGWTAEMIGDDICWMHFGEDGRLYAQNPEAGLFGVAPGTGWHTNPAAMRAVDKGRSHLHQRRPDRRRRRLVGGHDQGAPRAPDRAGSSEDWTPESGVAVVAPEQPVLHPDRQLRHPRPRVLRPEGRADLGDPLRRAARVRRPAGHRGPGLGARRLPRRDDEQRDHRRRGRCGRRRPARPDGDAAVHRLPRRATTSGTGSRSARGTTTSKLPKVFFVNWFRKSDDGRFLWPGFGENSRVLDVDHRPDRGDGGRRRDARSASCPLRARSTPRASTSTCADLEQALAVDPDGVAARGPAHRGVVRQDRRQDPDHPGQRARCAQGAPRGRLTPPRGPVGCTGRPRGRGTSGAFRTRVPGRRRLVLRVGDPSSDG